ncbi:OmpA family protein [Aestuariimicrobium ganziense]|uniref:hypothetical protein n=1 Tax=Aestuariimicrobium ganziense TaxID=2773677 RepID=UPI0019445391|nr:hypothetical protein [Aestuariimicrobium ganziense]
MPDLEEMTPGQVLADASVADFIGALGLSIAEAQRALDENSVAQIPHFTQPIPAMGNKTLLDLGLSPAFYHYQHADLSCSLQLSMRVQRSTGFDLGLNGSYSTGSTGSQSGSSSSSSTESGTSSSTSERTATLTVRSTATGAVTVGGRQFALTGDDPLTRVRALQQALTGDAQGGVPLALYTPPTDSFTITVAPPTPRIVTTSRTVTFLDTSFGAALIRISQNQATDFVMNPASTVTTTAQADLNAYADHVAAQVAAAGFDTAMAAPNEPVSRVYFKTGRHNLEVFTAQGSERNTSAHFNLMVLAGFSRDTGTRLRVQGYTDTQPYPGGAAASDTANRALGDRRAAEVRDLLIACGAPAANITVTPSTGAAAARAAGGQPVDDVTFRTAEISLEQPAHLLRVRTTSAANATTLEGVTPANLTPPMTSSNAFVYLYRPQSGSLSGTTVTVDGTGFGVSGSAGGGGAAGSARAHAFNLMTAVNAQAGVDFTASSDGPVVTLYKKSSPFQVQLFTTETRDMTITGSEGVTVTRQFTRTQSSSSSNQSTNNQAVAIGATVDVRYSRQFDTTVTGNSAITARLVSIPAPPQFLEAIKDFLTPTPNPNP